MQRFAKAIASLALSILIAYPVTAPPQNRKARAKTPAAQRRLKVRKDVARQRREKTFNLVWKTVNEENFDATFGGVDWNAVRLRYAPRASRVTTDQQLHDVLQQMLSEIPQSHFAIIPPEAIPRIRSRKELSGALDDADALSDDVENESDNDVATQMLNGIGVDVRILNGQVVITRLVADGPAAKAGLRLGFVIKSVDYMPLDDIPVGIDISPILHIRFRQRILVDYLGGEPGSTVRVAYLDEENKEKETMIKRERLKGSLSSSVGNLPPLYTELETKLLQEKIGYIRFTVFTPQLAEKICGAIKTMRDAPGLIIDLRGNPGGVMGMASGMVGLLTSRTGLIGTLKTRLGSLPIPTFPQRTSYNGPLVVLIDRLSGSTAEVMAAALQESGRALIVGERSAGEVLGANIITLPTGALFEYARAGFTTSKGTTLEGKGVAADVEKKLDRGSLLRGEDDQLEEAVRQIALKREAAKNSASITVRQPPPPPVVVGPTVSVSSRPQAEKSRNPPPELAPSFKSTPAAEAIMERYIKAVGGRQALERLKNRVSKGACTYPFQGLTGKVVIYEEAPNKKSLELQVTNVGVMRVVFDGKRGWTQDSLMGFYEYKGQLLSELRRDFDFYKITKYKELYSEIIYKGTIDSSQGKVDIIEVAASDGFSDELHFDVKTGLLVYGGGTMLGDYRQVDDVKIPFLMTIPVAGLEVKIQLQSVTHNVTIGPEAFAEPQSCFTGQ